VLRVRGRPRSHRVRRKSSTLRDVSEGFGFVHRSPLLLWMATSGVLFSVLFYSLFLPFAQAATARYPDPGALAGFFGVFGASVTGAAFLISIFFANRLLAWLGAAMLILILPVLYAGSFGALLASSAFATLVAVRSGVMVWLQGVSSPSWETLVNVVPDSRRDQVRAFLSGGPSQTGTAIAGILALIGQQAVSAKALSVIGLLVAVLTIWVGWRIYRSYPGALVDALRAGRPSVFGGRPVEGTAVVLQLDATALDQAIRACKDPDARIRRLGVEMLSSGGDNPRVRAELTDRVDDLDPTVRALAIRGLWETGGVGEPIIERASRDEDALVRRSVIEPLSAHGDESELLNVLQADTDPSVRAGACVALLRGPDRASAFDGIGRLLSNADPEVRLVAVGSLRSAAAGDALEVAVPMLRDPSVGVRAEALRALAAASPDAAVTQFIEVLDGDDATLRDVALTTLAELDVGGWSPQIRELAEVRGAAAQHDLALFSAIPVGGDRVQLLRRAVLERGRSSALLALSTVSLISRDGDAIRTAVANLKGDERGQLANALETLEATEFRAFAAPLIPLWDQTSIATTSTHDWIDVVSEDPDPLIRSCLDLVLAERQQGEVMGRSRTSISPMERVLALGKIPLFSALSTADLRHVADVAEERSFSEGEVISTEGETGDELHLIVEGTVSVIRGSGESASTVAHRGPGEVVGEMSIITHHPRVASLIAEDDVRTIRIGRREFESVIRERPDVSLAMMKVLAERLDQETRDHGSLH
jgi:HEAT repeat protein